VFQGRAGFGQCGRVAGIAEVHGIVGNCFGGGGERSPVRLHLAGQGDQPKEVVNLGEGNPGFNQARFQLLLNALLAEETSGVRHPILAPSQNLGSDGEVVLGLLNPLTRERLHRAPFPSSPLPA